MGRYKEEDVSRWSGRVSEQAASGKSVAAFCREHGLRDWQIYEWKKRLRQSEATSFVAVEVAVPAASASSSPVSVQMVGIELRHRRGWSLIVEPGFDAAHLHRLLSVLEMES
ncbi:IS66 family insertion sequence element accessory protein TnpA [Edaphobacter modestus]|uniref:Transposase n=1 Tax=Edaphobacter modestus TaxID=388466 RepID=A0A4Q7YSR5_9BACT|nr:transposase [Edaphobacter modestus]RZU40787.1 transposase [Edaphobacter modestus]